jgi:hypothetical protein
MDYVKAMLEATAVLTGSGRIPVVHNVSTGPHDTAAEDLLYLHGADGRTVAIGSVEMMRRLLAEARQGEEGGAVSEIEECPRCGAFWPMGQTGAGHACLEQLHAPIFPDAGSHPCRRTSRIRRPGRSDGVAPDGAGGSAGSRSWLPASVSACRCMS